MLHMARPSICSYSREMLGDCALNLGATSSAAYPAANDAIFLPMALSRPVLVKRLFSANGGVASGNIDMGIYTIDGARIVSIGSTAQAGTTTLQFFDIADTYLSPGIYYLAVAKNDTTGTLRRGNISLIRQQQWGIVKMATAFALPAAATFATVTATYVPLIGMELMGIV